LKYFWRQRNPEDPPVEEEEKKDVLGLFLFDFLEEKESKKVLDGRRSCLKVRQTFGTYESDLKIKKIVQFWA
jgi:hypothetical protein